MTLEIINISKRKNGTYRITVQDTGDQVGTDEKGAPIYQTYSTVYSPSEGKAIAKERLLKQIQERKAKLQEEQSIKSALESDLATLKVEEV